MIMDVLAPCSTYYFVYIYMIYINFNINKITKNYHLIYCNTVDLKWDKK